MCGFTGFYQKKPEGAEQRAGTARAMADRLSHRGPDHSAIWQDTDAPLTLAHRRLSIIDLSPEGHQPMVSASGRYVIVYNGETYNYQELRQELESAAQFRGRSDTEVFLAAVEQWGLNRALQKINGMFAMALWDRTERTLHLIRDRLGKKPLYVAQMKDCLIFGSELKALRAHPLFEAAINPHSLALYMRFGYMPAPHCIYKNVWSLRPGHRMSLQPEQLHAWEDLTRLMEPYWDHPRIVEDARRHPISAGDQDVIRDFENLLETCVRRRMVSDVPLGAFLSGGIDSSLVTAMMQKLSPAPVKTYTVRFDEKEFDESPHARQVAGHLGTDHHELPVTSKQALDIIPRLPDIYDEPFADISAIPSILLAQFARGQVTVALTGDGGDEMLGGYNRHVFGPRIRNAARFLPNYARRGAAGLLEMLSHERLGISSIHMQKVVAALPAASEEDLYSRLLAQWDVEAAYPDSPAWQTPAGMSFAERMMYWDSLSYLPDDVLLKVDRASMASSLECRAPLLDRQIYEYVWRLPLRFKIRNGQGKWLLRQILARHVPRDLFERPKQGFSVPVDAWLRGPLKDWAITLLHEMEDDMLNKDMILRAWDEHQNNNAAHGQKLWTVLMFLAWKKRWI